MSRGRMQVVDVPPGVGVSLVQKFSAARETSSGVQCSTVFSLWPGCNAGRQQVVASAVLAFLDGN
jgi:hypothetical protein